MYVRHLFLSLLIKPREEVTSQFTSFVGNSHDVLIKIIDDLLEIRTSSHTTSCSVQVFTGCLTLIEMIHNR